VIERRRERIFGGLPGGSRDDRPFGGKAAPTAAFYYSSTRKGEYPERRLAPKTGIIQVDAYSGYNALYLDGRQPARSAEATLRPPPDA
jgi:transposase